MGEEFDEEFFETRLEGLKDTQDAIQQMSAWCLSHKHHHKKIVSSWLNVFKRTRVEHRLVLYYLANDVIQYSKRKRFEFVESWATALQRATTMVRDEKVKHKILRILKIWQQREIYNDDFLSDLSGLLNTNPPNKPPNQTDSADEFQPAVLALKIRECNDASVAAERCFSRMPQAPETEVEVLKQNLKDKTHAETAMNEIDRYLIYMKAYEKNLMDELTCRRAVLSQLDKALKFYEEQQGEVRVVARAYKNFGFRVKCVKKRLEEITPNLSSPIPSPDVNAPSPEREADLQLPDEQPEFSASLFTGNLNGYLDGNLPFDINDFKRDDSSSNGNRSQPIEVIGSRSDDESFNSSTEYYKPEPLTPFSSASNISIPGLNPSPVPPVQSGYPRSAQQQRQQQSYGGGLLPPPPNPPHFGGNVGSTDYGSSGANYLDDMGGIGMSPHIPPPPMPPAALSVGMGGASTTPRAPGSNWNVNMHWQGMDGSNASSSSGSLYNPNLNETPHSPPHLDREPHNNANAPIEYSEHNNNELRGSGDIDQRQLLLPAFNINPTNVVLNKEKSRAVDVDHRNLISLTGSPGISNNNNKSWLSGPDKDYRHSVSTKNLKTIDTTKKPSSDNLNSLDSPLISPSGLAMPAPSAPISNKRNPSPHKSNASLSSESLKDDSSSRYDPTDQVVDMDMSDEDLDELYREYGGQRPSESESQQSNEISENHQLSATEISDIDDLNKSPLLLSPNGSSNSSWNAPSMSSLPPSFEQVQQQPRAWNEEGSPWNGGQFPGMQQQQQRPSFSGSPLLPPPLLQTPPQHAHAYHPYGGGRGRGWMSGGPGRGGGGGGPYGGSPGGNYMRGGPYRGGGGGYRGKFRGQNKNSWI